MGRIGVNLEQSESDSHRDLVGAGSGLCSFRDAPLGRSIYLCSCVQLNTEKEQEEEG